MATTKSKSDLIRYSTFFFSLSPSSLTLVWLNHFPPLFFSLSRRAGSISWGEGEDRSKKKTTLFTHLPFSPLFSHSFIFLPISIHSADSLAFRIWHRQIFHLLAPQFVFSILDSCIHFFFFPSFSLLPQHKFSIFLSLFVLFVFFGFCCISYGVPSFP